MSLKELQACTARLYVDDSFRTLFFQNPAVANDSYLLSDEELEILTLLDVKNVSFFATSLKKKRIKRLGRAYPLLFKADNPDVFRFAKRYCSLYLPHPEKSLHQDILDFGCFMEDTMRDLPGLPVYFSELARFEKIAYELSYLEKNWISPSSSGLKAERDLDLSDILLVSVDVNIHLFSFDFLKLNDELLANQSVTDSPAMGQFYLIAGFDQALGKMVMMQVSASVHDLLSHCNGLDTIETIVGKYNHHVYDDNHPVVKTIKKLIASGVLNYSDEVKAENGK